MKQDQYGNAMSTRSDAARDHHIAALDLLLAGEAGITAGFQAAIDADDGFALAYAGLARGCQFEGDMAGACAAMAQARARASNGDTREQSHIHALGLMIDGNVAAAYPVIRAHVDAYPRDALIAQTCSSVFGLIGFSGQPGREAEILAYTHKLLPHYGEDWWCLSQHAFALCETGALGPADTYIERALALRARNANGAHVRSHVYYETGETALGIDYLKTWMQDYDRNGYIYGHLSWHVALWALEQGDLDEMWTRLRRDIHPSASTSLPINVVTDSASLLYRAEMAGIEVPADLWPGVSTYAQKFFPKAGIGFIDIHSALAHAMAGEESALAALIDAPNPVTGDVVTPVARAFGAIIRSDWAEATAQLVGAMADHARLGGSRAQRDLLEFTLVNALLKQGRDAEARDLLTLRRPHLNAARAVHGLEAHVGA